MNPALTWDYDLAAPAKKFDYTLETMANPKLVELRNYCELYAMVEHCETELESTLTVIDWVSRLWKHKSEGVPASSDPLSIVKAAQEGGRFRSMEYAIVAHACLSSLGIPTRRVALKTADASTRIAGAGHCVLEVYLEDFDKWVYVDPQENLMVGCVGLPLTTVEFFYALKSGSKIDILSRDVPDSAPYMKWIAPYLYYIDTPIDNRLSADNVYRDRLMLTPVGTKNPKVFQKTISLQNYTYTQSAKTFYTPPV